MVLDTSVQTGGDYGVTVTVPDITQLVAFVGSQVTFWGSPADPRHDTQRGTCLAGGAAAEYVNTGKKPACPLAEAEPPFLIMPTSCLEPAHTTVEGDSWSQQGVKPLAEYTFQDSEGDPFRFDGCNRLNFEPSITVKSDSEQASTPTGLNVDVHVPQDASLNPNGLAESAVKRITVTLPEGVAVDPSGADGLEACSEGLIGYLPSQSTPPDELHFTSALPEPLEQGVNFCPEASKVATSRSRRRCCPTRWKARRTWPRRTRTRSARWWRCTWSREDPVSGVLVKLAGEVCLNENTGQFVATFEKRRSCRSKTSNCNSSAAGARAAGDAGVVRGVHDHRVDRAVDGERSGRRLLADVPGSPPARTAPRAPTRCRSARR